MKEVITRIMFLPLFALFAAPVNSHAADQIVDNTSAVVKEIGQAKSEILVQADSLTGKDIAESLADAHKRGVRTQIILDKSSRSQKYSVADFTRGAGIPTYIDAEHDIPENGIIIIDRETVITDSFNFTRSTGERNTQNLLILRSNELANMYVDNWKRHRSHSEAYAGRQ